MRLVDEADDPARPLVDDADDQADLGVFLISDCNSGTSCVDFDDIVGAGSIATITPGPLAPGPYYVYIDSYYAAGAESCGDYTLEVSGILPVELLDFDVE